MAFGIRAACGSVLDHPPLPATREHRVVDRSAILKAGALVAILAAAAVVAHANGWLDLRRVSTLAAMLRREHSPPGAAALFVAAYAAVTAVGLPTTPATLAGGIVFGFRLGASLSWLGTVIGSAAGYGLARAVGTESLRQLLRGNRRLAAMTDARGFVPLLRLQLLPVVPLGVLNFSAGAAKVHWPTYLATVAIGVLPGIAIYAYFASSLAAGAAGAKRDAMVHVAVASGLLILLTGIPTAVRAMRRRGEGREATAAAGAPGAPSR
jgi:uncharacterized membrane protein YdjX (TVP38/TMEM64 family)